jgi:hypothetical protein
MESSDKFFIEFNYNNSDHELVITALLSDFVDFLEDDFELDIYDNKMVLIFQNLYWIYEIYHKLSIIQSKSLNTIQFRGIKIIDCYLDFENIDYPEFKLKVKQGFFMEKKKACKDNKYLMQEF